MIIFADILVGTSICEQPHMVWVERESVPSSLCVCQFHHCMAAFFFTAALAAVDGQRHQLAAEGFTRFHYVHGKHWHLSSTDKKLVCFQQRKLLLHGGYNCFQQTLLLTRWNFPQVATFVTSLLPNHHLRPSHLHPIHLRPNLHQPTLLPWHYSTFQTIQTSSSDAVRENWECVSCPALVFSGNDAGGERKVWLRDAVTSWRTLHELDITSLYQSFISLHCA